MTQAHPDVLISSDSSAARWQQALSDLITDPLELAEMLDLDLADRPLSAAGLKDFPLKVPRAFAARMRPGDWNDPLLLQVWPAHAESIDHATLSKDPLQEAAFTVAPGVLQKYQGRALLMAAPHCAIHCRYCFRRHFDYDANSPSRREWLDSLSVIGKDPSIKEAILSGGDPLANNDRQLAWLIDQLGNIRHLHTLRIHTRLPIVIPERINAELLAALQRCRLKVVVVLHCNHAREIDADCEQALQALRAAGATLLNQAVVLAGINDNVTSLKDLSERLFDCGVMPYYLHLPDDVAGTAHFMVDEQRAKQLMKALRGELPGYLVPRLVQEVPGQDAKTILG